MIDLADDHYELDISRATALLDWTPQHRLLTMLPAMVYALKTDPVDWYRRNKREAPDDLEARTPPPKTPACEVRSQPHR